MSQRELWKIRKMVQRLFPTTDKHCEMCQSTEKIERHHRDGNIKRNPKNGKNIAYLCASCHDELHSKTGYVMRNVLAMVAV